MAITKKQKVILLFCCTSISIYKLGTGNSHKPEGEIYHSARLEPFFFLFCNCNNIHISHVTRQLHVQLITPLYFKETKQSEQTCVCSSL